MIGVRKANGPESKDVEVVKELEFTNTDDLYVYKKADDSLKNWYQQTGASAELRSNQFAVGIGYTDGNHENIFTLGQSHLYLSYKWMQFFREGNLFVDSLYRVNNQPQVIEPGAQNEITINCNQGDEEYYFLLGTTLRYNGVNYAFPKDHTEQDGFKWKEWLIAGPQKSELPAYEIRMSGGVVDQEQTIPFYVK